MASDALHETYRDTLARRLRIAVLALLAAALPAAAILYTAREVLKPLTERSDVQVFSLTFLSILFEAIPFILLGALVSGLIETFVSPQTMLRLIPKSRLGQLAVGATVGVLLPVCECGVVVVLRRLLRKGMPLGMAVAYLLAAPIVNPVVIASTFAAFRGKPEWLFMPVARVASGVLLAMAIAAVVGRRGARQWLKVTVQPLNGSDPHAHASVARRLSAACDHAVSEFLDVIKYLIAGAMAAALIQTALPRTAVDAVGHNPILGILGMMALAVGLNLCSEADAFVAASFLNFTAVAKLAFLVLGPMFDIKLLAMYAGVFRRPLIWRLVAAILIGVFVTMALLALVMGGSFGSAAGPVAATPAAGGP